ELFKAADKNGDGVVTLDELAALLAAQQEEPLMHRCPVCGETLEVSDNLNNMIHLTSCFDEGTGNQVMTGGFLTDKQAAYGITEVKHPLDYFKTFNEFFISELKPGVRPIAHVESGDVAPKGRKFSVQGPLGQDISASYFKDGSLVIFRLAQQDFLRFLFSVSGFIEQIVNMHGCLYIVNPVAVNSKYCNVLTENKSSVAIISTSDFGKVAFVAIGATLVGSLTFKKGVFKKGQGDNVKKGEEFGYFSLVEVL
uniref:EF-hand domain-containing protein n=1 Tax=Cucumis melo TaxID=3656 RepID=A0A9I9CGH6_CUCME